jgi:signal transduction histidine kinase
MESDEPRSWRQYVRDALRPEESPDPLPWRELLRDALLAAVATCMVLWHAFHTEVGAQVVGVAPGAPGAPGAPPAPGTAGLGSAVGAVGAGGVPDAPGPYPPAAHPFTEPLPMEPRTVLLVTLTALPLLVRRRFPLSAFWVVLCAALADPDLVSWITVATLLIATASALRYSRNPVPATGGFALAATLVSFAFRHDDTPPVPPGLLVALLVLAALAGLARCWQLRLQAARQRLLDLEREQREATRRAVEEERARIAAELHDVVTHNVSVMVIQAGAARKVLDSEPELAREALLAVESGGRAAMAELRHVMGLLAASGTGRDAAAGRDELEPQPGLGQLAALVDRVRAAGTPVSVDLAVPPEPLPSGVDLTAYRVVQEALTNTVKHAAGASATVAIGHDGDWLEIEVADSGGTPGPQARTGGGRGLIGLRERLAVYGGTLESGRRIGGGYVITARVPWRTA